MGCSWRPRRTGSGPARPRRHRGWRGGQRRANGSFSALIPLHGRCGMAARERVMREEAPRCIFSTHGPSARPSRGWRSRIGEEEDDNARADVHAGTQAQPDAPAGQWPRASTIRPPSGGPYRSDDFHQQREGRRCLAILELARSESSRSSTSSPSRDRWNNSVILLDVGVSAVKEVLVNVEFGAGPRCFLAT